MAFDKQAEKNEPEYKIELIFKSGKPDQPKDFVLGPSAYIAMSSFSKDTQGRPMLTHEEMSFGTLKADVDYIKACLDARLADAKARFAAAGVAV